MEFNASSASFEHRLDLAETIFANMNGKAKGNVKAGIMLAGDPGVGKTSFIRFFSTLVGISEITIEAPHITEEHIINIPFIVHDPITKQDTQGSTDFNASDFKVVMSDSNLFTRLNKIRKVSDDQYLKSIYQAPADVIKVFEELGGSKDEIPDVIAKAREKFKVILFLDEYFRQTSVKIRNMLRSILDNKIGAHDLPAGTYVIYASNLEDSGGGVEGEIPANNEFKQINISSPKKDDWFHWLVSKFEKDEKVKLDPRVIQKFYDILEDEELNNNDTDKELEIRTSPRRWEQTLLYINSSLPVKNQQEAQSLLTNIKAGLSHYLTGETSSLATKVLKAIAELIKETSDIEISPSAENTADEWKETLKHQIEQKMKLGNHRKYIPIISGLPGVGKTTHAQQIAKDEDLRYIYINCSNLNAEDVLGLPLPASNNKKKIETNFSEPTLYQQILKECEGQDEDYIEHLKHKLKGEEAKKAIKEYKDREWKYLIFFDEINRNSSKVFNGIRKLLLEKKFGDGLELPKEAIVMAAINPKDVGAEPLTDHMRDVVDVLDAHANFEKTKTYLKNRDFGDLKNPMAKDVVFDTLMKFVDKFRVKNASKEIPNSQRSFYLDIGAEPIFISQREYSDLYSDAVEDFDIKLTRYLKKLGANATSEDLMKTEKKLRETLFNSFRDKLAFIFTKHGIKSPAFIEQLEDWFHSSAVEFGEGLYYKKASVVSVESLLSKFFDDPQADRHLADDIDFESFLENNDPHKFKEALSSFLVGHFDSDEDVQEKLIKKAGKGKTVKDQEIEFEEEEVSKFEHLIREMVNAIKILDLDGQHKEAIKEAVVQALKAIREKHGANYMSELLEFNSRVRQLVKGL